MSCVNRRYRPFDCNEFDIMRVLILNGCGHDEQPAALVSLLETATSQYDAAIRRFDLDSLTLAPCQGEFDCWVKTPGVCRSHDEAQTIAQAMHDTDLVIALTPVTFGGYGSALKKVLDRLICLVEPFFEKREGLTHHTARYEHYPAFLFIGTSANQVSAHTARTFIDLCHDSALNLRSTCTSATCVSFDDSQWHEQAQQALERALRHEALPRSAPSRSYHDALLEACSADAPSLIAPPSSVTLLVGSARPRGQSTSESLGRALLAPLEFAGAKTQVVHAIRFVKPGKAFDEALEAILASDLLVVSSPLYVDTLPALLTRALEAARPQLATGLQPVKSVAGIFNCGFPEAAHNRNAMQVLKNFTHDTGLRWAGGLAMGGGEAIHGRPLADLGGMVRAQALALRLAGQQLSHGQPIPAEAIANMARGLLPAFLYRWVGGLGWAVQARAHGVARRRLHDRPLDGER